MRTMPYLLTAAAATSLLACDSTQPPSSAISDATPDLASGVLTSEPAQAHTLVSHARLKPIITVGDPIPGQETNPDVEQRVWAPIPDGLGAYSQGQDLVLFANHEISSSGVGGRFTYARVSRLVLDQRSLGVKSGSYAITGKATGFLFQRLCAATFIGEAEGFDGWFFTGEESTSGGPDGESGLGIQLAVSADGAQTLKLPWLGRMAHENYIAVPGFRGKTVMIGTDDTSPSSTGALRSELYMYVADDEHGVLHGSGKLYVFTSSGAINSGYLESGSPIRGDFVEITDPASYSPTSLQTKVNALGAFKFVRLEDVDYARDRKRSIYFVDTGNSDALCGTAPCDESGSIYRMDLDPSDPTQDARLVLLDRSEGAEKGWASPDNISLSSRSLMLQEDPAYSGFTRAPRIWNFKLRGHGHLGKAKAVVEMNNPDCFEPSNNCWESSGIIDASEWLGEGSWLFDVQAHSLAVPALGLSSEGGQLLYLKLPGS